MINVGLVYDHMGLSGITTVRPGVTGVLQMVLELTLVVSRARTGQLRRIRWRMSQGHGYVRMTHGSSGRDTIWYVCCYLNVRYVYASTGCTYVVKGGRSWLGVDQRGHQSSKGWTVTF
jgi:hypothetical protein